MLNDLPPKQVLKGLEVFTWSDNQGRIERIRLPLSESAWCQLCMREGRYYFGGCCGSMSYVQDILNSTFRDGGVIHVADLSEMAQVLAQHGDVPFKEGTRIAPVLRSFKALPPYSKIAVIWHIIKNAALAPKINSDPIPVERDLRWGVRELKQCIYWLDTHYLFEGLQSKTDQSAEMVVGLARLIPALKIVQDRIHELCPPPFEGFAVVDEQHNVAVNGLGLCLYTNEEEALRCKSALNEYCPSIGLQVKRVHVSVEHENGYEVRT